MKDVTEKLNIAKNAVALPHESKAKIRARLVDYMNAHPVEKPSLSWRSRFAGIVSMLAFRPLPAVFAIGLIIISAGSLTAYAAQKSLPGQMLYGWKTGINERVQLALISGDEAQADFEMTLATRRLAEADILARSNSLEESAQQQVRAGFALQANRIQQRIEQLEVEHNDIAAAALKQRFAAAIASPQKNLLEAGEARDERSRTDEQGAAAIISKINAADSAILSTEAMVSLSQESKIADQSQSLDSDKLDSSKKDEIKKAAELLKAAREKLKQGNKKDAEKLSQEAIAISRKVIAPKRDDEDKSRNDASDDSKNDRSAAEKPTSGALKK